METPRTETGARRSTVAENGCPCLPVAGGRSGLFWGAALLVIGGLWLLGNLGLIPVGGALVLPLLVVALGLWYLVAGVGG